MVIRTFSILIINHAEERRVLLTSTSIVVLLASRFTASRRCSRVEKCAPGGRKYINRQARSMICSALSFGLSERAAHKGWTLTRFVIVSCFRCDVSLRTASRHSPLNAEVARQLFLMKWIFSSLCGSFTTIFLLIYERAVNEIIFRVAGTFCPGVVKRTEKRVHHTICTSRGPEKKDCEARNK